MGKWARETETKTNRDGETRERYRVVWVEVPIAREIELIIVSSIRCQRQHGELEIHGVAVGRERLRPARVGAQETASQQRTPADKG